MGGNHSTQKSTLSRPSLARYRTLMSDPGDSDRLQKYRTIMSDPASHISHVSDKSDGCLDASPARLQRYRTLVSDPASHASHAGDKPDGCADASPTAGKSKLVRYRTLLTGQTVFDAGHGKDISRCTSRASSEKDDKAQPLSRKSSFKSGKSARSGKSHRSALNCRANDRMEGECDSVACTDEAVAQLGGVPPEDLLYGMQLATLAYAGNSVALQHQGMREAIAAVAGGPCKAALPVEELVGTLALSLDHSFSHAGSVDVHGIIAHGENEVVLAYSASASEAGTEGPAVRGTSEFSPLLQRQGFGLVMDCCGGGPRADEEFLNAFMSSVPDLEKKLLPQLDASKPTRLVIAGHGLGGAVATGALAYLLKRVDFAKTPHKVLFLSAGQPRFGNASFGSLLEGEIGRLERLDKCIYGRLVYEFDPVPAGPRGLSTLVHVGVPSVLTPAGEVVVGQAEPSAGAGTCSAVSASGEMQPEHQPARYLALVGGC